MRRSLLILVGCTVLVGCPDPLQQDCPVMGEACYPIKASFVCAIDASGESGAQGDPCEYINVCDPGLACDYSEQLHAVPMALAEALLRDPQLSVEDVCHRVGFASLAGFSRFFTARSGVAPSQFPRGGPPLRTNGARSDN